MHVHVVAGVVVGRGTGFIFRRACAVVNDVHQTLFDEERESACDGRAVDGVECLFYLKRREGTHGIVEHSEHKPAHGRGAYAVVLYPLFYIV